MTDRLKLENAYLAAARVASDGFENERLIAISHRVVEQNLERGVAVVATVLLRLLFEKGNVL